MDDFKVSIETTDYISICNIQIIYMKTWSNSTKQAPLGRKISKKREQKKRDACSEI